MNEQEEFEFQLQLEKEQAGKAVTGRAKSPKFSPEVKKQSALGLLKDAAVGGMKTAVNMGTHVVDAVTVPLDLWSKAASVVSPTAGQFGKDIVTSARDRGAEARKFWQQQYEEAGPAAFAGSLATDIAGTAGLGKPALKVAERVLPRVLGETGKRAINRVSIAGAGAGGVGGALTADDAGTGGAVGTVTGAVVPRVLRKALLGINKSKAAESLLQQGVPLTTGIAAPNAGMGSVVTGSETFGRWLPIVGHVIENSQQKAVRGWRDVALRNLDVPSTSAGPAVKAGTTMKTGASVDDIISQQRQAIKQRQNVAMENQKFLPDQELEEAILKITSDPDRLLDARGVAKINDLYKRAMIERVRGQQPTPGSKIIIAGKPPPMPPSQSMEWTGRDILHAKKVFERAGNKMTNSQDPFTEGTGKAMRDVADEILAMVERQNPTAGTTLRALEAPSHAAKVIKAAGKSSGGTGTFTPKMLTTASQKFGHEGLETLGREGGEVFGNINTGVRSKGTDLRSLAQWLGMAGHLWSPEVAIATVGGSLGYIPKVQRGLLGQTKGQKELVNLLRRKGLGDLVGE